MKQYRCKHAVEALRWTDTDANRELFATWFEKHDAMFETRGPVIVLPEEGQVDEGAWAVYSDGEFLVMTDESFRGTYEEISEATCCPTCRSSSPASRLGSRVMIWPPGPIARCKDAWHDRSVKHYKCTHAVEALRWADTVTGREAFAAWFKTHGTVFETRGSEIVMPAHKDAVAEGMWVFWDDAWDDENFMVLDDDAFRETYVEAS